MRFHNREGLSVVSVILGLEIDRYDPLGRGDAEVDDQSELFSFDLIGHGSVPAIDDVAALPKTVGKRDLHLLGLCVRHRVQMRVQPRHEALAAPLDDACGLDAPFVILEPLLRREAGHTDVVTSLTVAARVPKVNHVNGVVIPPASAGHLNGLDFDDFCGVRVVPRRERQATCELRSKRHARHAIDRL